MEIKENLKDVVDGHREGCRKYAPENIKIQIIIWCTECNEGIDVIDTDLITFCNLHVSSKSGKGASLLQFIKKNHDGGEKL
jgi:hypothetical protein